MAKRITDNKYSPNLPIGNAVNSLQTILNNNQQSRSSEVSLTHVSEIFDSIHIIIIKILYQTL